MPPCNFITAGMLGWGGSSFRGGGPTPSAPPTFLMIAARTQGGGRADPPFPLPQLVYGFSTVDWWKFGMMQFITTPCPSQHLCFMTM